MQSELISKSGRLNDRPTANANEREWVITCTDGTEFVSLYRSVQVSKWVPATVLLHKTASVHFFYYIYRYGGAL